MRQIWHITYKWARRCVIAVIGGTVVAIGVAMIVLPGPAIVVIPAGLAILSLEFAFAKRWLAFVREQGDSVMTNMRSWTMRCWSTRSWASWEVTTVETSTEPTSAPSQTRRITQQIHSQ